MNHIFTVKYGGFTGTHRKIRWVYGHFLPKFFIITNLIT